MGFYINDSLKSLITPAKATEQGER